jgi:mannose-6-phosphate isomerase-like protein (cupin superfamily)
VYHRSLKECPEIVAGDRTRLRELLHPKTADLKLRYSLAHATLPAGATSLLHSLAASEVCYILAGRGHMEIDGQSREVVAGDTIYIPPAGAQRIESLGPKDLEFLCIVDPAWRAEDETILE